MEKKQESSPEQPGLKEPEALLRVVEYCTIGPVPINGVVNIMTQLRDQGWYARHVAFSGMIAMQEKISISRPIPLPSYMIVAEKYFTKGEEFVPPNIKLDGGSTPRQSSGTASSLTGTGGARAIDNK